MHDKTRIFLGFLQCICEYASFCHNQLHQITCVPWKKRSITKEKWFDVGFSFKFVYIIYYKPVKKQNLRPSGWYEEELHCDVARADTCYYISRVTKLPCVWLYSASMWEQCCTVLLLGHFICFLNHLLWVSSISYAW